MMIVCRGIGIMAAEDGANNASLLGTYYRTQPRGISR